ncbi:MAG: hypothetical protein LBF66_01160 [Holosporales bacterium]|nr:hypothetical protein [Holosporales bacterium]
MARVLQVAAFALFSLLANVGRGSSAEDGCSGSPFPPPGASFDVARLVLSGDASCQEIPEEGKRRQRRRFTAAEDALICQCVSSFGTANWDEVAAQISGRTARQCKERWKRYLSVGLTTRRWTRQESELLRSKIQEFGPKWTILAQFFPGRTDIQLKNHWLRKLAHRAGGLKSTRRQPGESGTTVGSSDPVARKPLAGAAEEDTSEVLFSPNPDEPNPWDDAAYSDDPELD